MARGVVAFPQHFQLVCISLNLVLSFQ
jgi:hypothetical protein